MKGKEFPRAVVACLAVLALGVSGCGSNGGSTNADASGATTGETTESSSPSSGPLTKAEFVKEANRICHEGLAKKDENVSAGLKDLAPNNASTPSRETVGKLVTVAIIPVYSEIIEQLGELTAPKGDEAAVNLMAQKYEAAMQAAEADPASAVEKNPFQAGDKAAEAYGITGCIL